MRLDPPSLQYLRRSNLSFRAYTFKTSRYAPAQGGGGALPVTAYTERLRPKGVPFSGSGYIKRQGFH